MSDNRWDDVVKFYEEKFNVTPDLVELATDFDVLKMCAAGSSTGEISEFLNISYHDVETILLANYGFRGWEYPLKVNPVKLYEVIEDKSFNTFAEYVTDVAQYEEDQINTMWLSAKAFKGFQELLDEKWV